MSGDGETPRRYEVSISGRARGRLLELSEAARERGSAEEFVAALREFNRRLQVYPRFGDPLADLKYEEGHIRLGIVPPLVMRCGVLEESRLVSVMALPVLLSKPV